MDILNQIIQTMNKEEVRHYKLFSARTQVKGERKDIQLFDYIRKTGEGYDEEWIFDKLYGDSSKNPFYRLKNRLLGDINKSLNLQHLDDDEIAHIFHMLSLSRFFYNRSKYDIALHYIRRAEKKAIRLGNFELLDFIYSELVKLSHEIISINPEEYIRKRQENKSNLDEIREIEDLLALVTYRIKVSAGYGISDVPIYKLLEKTVDDFALKDKIEQKPKLRFTIYNAVSRLLLSRREFPALEEYLLKTYDTFNKEGLFTKSTHDSKLQMLVYIVNTLFKNRKPELSLKYAEVLNSAMEEYNRLHYKKYLIYYYNALIINYRILDLQKYLEILLEVTRKGEFKDNPFYDFLNQANLSVGYFNHGIYDKAIKVLIQAYLHDGYKLADDSFKVHLGIYELTLRLETSEYDVVEKSIENLKKDFSELFAKEEYLPSLELIKIIEAINRSPNPKADEKLLAEARKFLDRNPSDQMKDYSFIHYEEWLTEKLGILPRESST